MADHYFSLNPNREEHFQEKISLDSLFERKRQINQSHLSIYQKILHRIHERIKHTARQKNSDDFCFYIVPEFMFGIPRYNVATCVSYVMEKLEENGFVVKYTHPNLLFISWKHYIPSYQREEIRKRTGYRINGFGKILGGTEPAKRDNSSSKPLSGNSGNSIWDKHPSFESSTRNKKQVSFLDSNNPPLRNEATNPNPNLTTSNATSKESSKAYRDVNSYRPSGNLVYDEDLLSSVNKKLKMEDTILDNP